MSVGIRKKAKNLNGDYTYLDSKEDIKWLFEVHLKDVNTTLTAHSVTAALLYGNEDAPDEVWVTEESEVTIHSWFTRLL